MNLNKDGELMKIIRTFNRMQAMAFGTHSSAMHVYSLTGSQRILGGNLILSDCLRKISLDVIQIIQVNLFLLCFENFEIVRCLFKSLHMKKSSIFSA